jgi:hypothetical protein
LDDFTDCVRAFFTNSIRISTARENQQRALTTGPAAKGLSEWALDHPFDFPMRIRDYPPAVIALIAREEARSATTPWRSSDEPSQDIVTLTSRTKQTAAFAAVLRRRSVSS